MVGLQRQTDAPGRALGSFEIGAGTFVPGDVLPFHYSTHLHYCGTVAACVSCIHYICWERYLQHCQWAWWRRGSFRIAECSKRHCATRSETRWGLAWRLADILIVPLLGARSSTMMRMIVCKALSKSENLGTRRNVSQWQNCSG
jgi:hypothetical protein